MPEAAPKRARVVTAGRVKVGDLVSHNPRASDAVRVTVSHPAVLNGRVTRFLAFEGTAGAHYTPSRILYVFPS